MSCNLSLFFDGTGNNREKDTESSSWSNVGCMCDATLQDDAKSTYAIYIAGVGTRYNGKATGWLDSTSIWVEDKLGGLSGLAATGCYARATTQSMTGLRKC